jgi:hypothetical protein
MNITYAGLFNKYTEAEREGVQWLTQQTKWAHVYVTRLSPREFDLMLSRPENGTSLKAWFPLAALSQFRDMQLYTPRENTGWALRQNAEIWFDFGKCLDEARKRPIFSRALERAVYGTWQALAEEGLGRMRNSEAIELVLDADRMTYAGYAAEDKELDFFIDRFGYEKVAKALAYRVKLA